MSSRPSVRRGSSQDAARESVLNMPLWLPLSVAVLSLLVFEVIVPAMSPRPGGVARLLGLVLIAASVATLVVRWQTQRRLHSLVRTLTTTEAVQGLSPQELHDLVIAALMRRGWHKLDDVIEGAPGETVVMSSERVRRAVFFVSAGAPVGQSTVRELETAVRGKARALVISSAGFTADSIVFARQIGIELVDAQGVVSLMGELRRETTTVGPLPSPTFVWEDEVLSGTPQSGPATSASGAKLCPTCGSTMRPHQNATTRYWACSRYPDCNGIVVGR